MPLMLPVVQANCEHADAPVCCCRGYSRLSKTDLGLSMLAVVGCLMLPKCPLCLAAWVAMLSGLSLSVGVSNVVLTTLSIVAVGCFLVGMIRLGNAIWKNLRRRSY